MSGYDERHRAQREALGAFALGHLSGPEATALQAHLDGCDACRAELADLRTVVPDLHDVDLRGFDVPPTPPPSLGDAIVAAVSRERVLRDRRARAARTSRRLTVGATAVAASAALLAVGLGIGRTTAPAERITAQPVPMEAVELVGSPGISVASAVLVPHTWGVEARFVATGLDSGTSYRAWFVARSGARFPAGEFLGVGTRRLTCNMQAALLRPDAAGFVVLDPNGRTVLSAALPA